MLPKGVTTKYMRFFLKQFTILLLLGFVCTGIVWGESNFDFFFKNTAQYKDVVITEILSADRFRLKENLGEKGEVIKLIGLKALNAPKKKTEDIKRDEFGIVIKEPVNPLTPIEEEAFEFTRELLEGQHVRLEFDANKLSEKNETLAYVFLLENDTFVNTEILRQGFAYLSIRPPNTKYADELRAAYKEARSEQRGLQGQ
jgi:hypothetical protein